MDLKKDYQKYRWFFTSSEKLVVGGKNEKQNEELVNEFIGKPNVIIHTEEPGSPFMIILGRASQKDIEETSIFTACFSQQWKKAGKDAEVHIFTGKQVRKDKRMKPGTFGVSKILDKKKVKLELVISIQKKDENEVIGKVRAVPLSCYKDKDVWEYYDEYRKKWSRVEHRIPKIILIPGKTQKKDAALEIQRRLAEYGLEYPLEEVEQAIPAGGFNIK